MNAKHISLTGLLFLVISLLLLSQGFEFLMSQKPIDFSHWSMLFGSLFMISLWVSLPHSISKNIGLVIMTLGVAGVIGMCVIDFLMWSMNDDQEARDALFQQIIATPSIHIPFLIAGPSLFYTGICISTYGLIKRFTWQVIILNIGCLLIGLGLMMLQNGIITSIGALFLLVGLGTILAQSDNSH